MNPAISVVIRTKNESKYLGGVLERLKQQEYEWPAEIIVVDSGSTDDTVAIAEAFGCTIVSMKAEEFSFGKALNRGIESASGEIVINLSGHSVPVDTNYFALMVKPFSEENVAATFGRDVPWPEACPSQAKDISRHFPVTEIDGNRFSNANAAIRKEIWQEVKFDELISATEDLLWAKQVMNLGYVIKYVPEAKVFHSHTASIKYIYKRAFIESMGLNSFSDFKREFSLIQGMKFSMGQAAEDILFTLRNRYNFFWLFHIPLYRFSQGLGLVKGFRKGARSSLDALTRVGQYDLGQEIPKSRKKVLMVTHCFFPESVGGTEYYTLTLARKLIERGWDVKIISAMRDLTQKRYKVIESRHDGISVIKIINPSELCTRFIEHFIDHTIEEIFARIVAIEKPEVIHFQHTAYLSARLPEIAHQSKIPSVFTLHDYWYMCFRSQLIRPLVGVCPGPSEGLHCATCSDPEQPHQGGVPRFPRLMKILQFAPVRQIGIKEKLPPKLKRVLKRLLYINKTQTMLAAPDIWNIFEHSFRLGFMKRQLSFPAHVISPSVHLKKRYEREGFRDIVYIPHGFEPVNKVDSLPFTGKLVLAYLSNIIPFKGADIILKELKYVTKRRMLQILFYGKVLDDGYRQELEVLAKEYPDVDIAFMGAYKGKGELARALSGVHFVVFPSVWEENHPLVVREALQYGIPVISSSLGGAPEAIENGINGFVFDPYKEGDLAAKINLILDNPEILKKISEGARNTKIESMEDHVEKVITLYGSALETHG
jgi:rhamnosyltransferase